MLQSLVCPEHGAVPTRQTALRSVQLCHQHAFTSPFTRSLTVALLPPSPFAFTLLLSLFLSIPPFPLSVNTHISGNCKMGHGCHWFHGLYKNWHSLQVLWWYWEIISLLKEFQLVTLRKCECILLIPSVDLHFFPNQCFIFRASYFITCIDSGLNTYIIKIQCPP